jgi:Zn-dependent protease
MIESLPSLGDIAAIALPVIVAITLHEAAHGFVAYRFGDTTAYEQGRVTLNPIKHVDPFGTIILPIVLYITTKFMIGWAKPVPVDPSRLGRPRRDMVLVAAAGPAMNIALALLSGVLLAVFGTRDDETSFVEKTLAISIYVNVLLAVFNLIPLPPLDGGRIAVGLLPAPLAWKLQRLEPWGIWIVLFVIVLVPWLSGYAGARIDPFGSVFYPVVRAIMEAIVAVTGAGRVVL